MLDTSWGTGSRLIKSKKYFDIIPVALWCLFLLYCFIRSCINEIINEGYKNPFIIGSVVLNIILTLGLIIYYNILKKRNIKKIMKTLNRITKKDKKTEIVVKKMKIVIR
jgi:hypothetical protein